MYGSNSRASAMAAARQWRIQVWAVRADRSADPTLTKTSGWLWLGEADYLRHWASYHLNPYLFAHLLYENAKWTKSFQLQALFRGLPRPLSRGSAPGPRWGPGPRPQTPV